MKRIAFFLSLFALISVSSLFLPSNAGAEDVTLIGPNEALYSLGDPLNAEVTTTENVVAKLEIADVIVEETRVLVRFFVHGISPAWAVKITDPKRVGGDYLPVMELGLPSGEWETPTTASRYSLTVTEDDLVVAGLAEFLTDEKADFMILNFNQIPFDLAPLAEGASFPLFLLEGDNKQRSPIANPMSVTADGITLSLLNVAESPNISMFQPGITVERPGEYLSGIGWFSLTAADGRSVVLERDIGYGFNLSNDGRYFLRNCYYFNANRVPGPLTIGLDKVYVTRLINGSEPVTWASATKVGERGELNIPLPLGSFDARITEYEIFAARRTDENHRHAFVRLWFDVPEAVTAIHFGDVAGELNLASDCGVDPSDGRFACDVPIFTTLDYDMILYPYSFEYTVKPELNIEWTPVRYTKKNTIRQEFRPIHYDFSELTGLAETDPRLDETVRAVLNRGYLLRERPGWIVQESLIQNEIPNPNFPALINRAVQQLQPFAYRSIVYDQVDASGNVVETVSLQQDPNGKLINGSWTTADFQISLPRGYRLDSGNALISGYSYPYVYAQDFLALAGSPSRLESVKDCRAADRDAACFTFIQSLLENPSADNLKETIRLKYAIDRENGALLRSETMCLLNEDDRALSSCSVTTVERSEWIPELPDDVRALLSRYIFE